MKPNVSPTAARAALVAFLIAALATIASAQTAPTFTVRPAAIGETGPQDAVAADFDNDGDLDLLVTTAGLFAPGAPPPQAKLNFLMNDGTGLLAKASALNVSAARRVAVADLNRDGVSDLAVAVGPGGQCFMQGGVAVFLGSAGGTFTQNGSCLGAGNSPIAIQAADFNGDSLADLAVASNDGSPIRVFRGNGIGGFQPPTLINDSGIGVSDMATPVDLNGDNRLDIVVGYNVGFRAFLGRGDGTFITGGNTAPGGQTLAIAVGDVTGEGIADLAEVSAAAIRIDTGVGVGVGNGSFSVGVPSTIGPGLQDIALADMDDDGDLDIVIAGGAQGVGTRLLVNNGTGGFPSFASSIAIPGGPNPVRVVAGDFNGDGASDAAIVDGTVNQVFVALQNLVDRTAPTVEILSPADGSQVSGNVNVSATANDNVGVTSVEFFVNGTSIGSDATGPDYTVSWDASLLAGSRTISARASDAAGLTGEDTAVVTVLDIAKPSAPADLTGRSLDNFHFVRLNWTASTDNAGVDHYRVYELVRGSSNTLRWELVKDGVDATTAIAEIEGRRGQAHTFGVTAVDAAGNESERAVVAVSRDDNN
jgi:Bacterial Ig domain/FG-GAP-like repeat